MFALKGQFCRLPQKLQFILTGGSGWVLGSLIMYLFIDGYGWSVSSATAIMLVVTFAYNFALNRWCTWRDRDVDRLCLAKFVASRAVTAYATWIAIGYLVHYIGYLEANTLCVGIATAINWAGSDRWVFTPWLVPPSTEMVLRRMIRENPDAQLASKQPVAVFSTDGLPEGKVLPQWPEANVRRVRRLPSQVRTSINAGLLLALLGAIGYGFSQDVRGTFITVVALNTIPMLIIGSRTLALTVYFWRTPWDADENRDRLDSYAAPLYTFNILVAASHEEGVLYRNLCRIMELDYPRDMFRVFVAVTSDDPGTLVEARQAEADFPGNIILVVVDPGDKKSKPIALNEVLRHQKMTNDLTFWLDAESWPAPELLLHFNTLVQRHPEVGVWQGGVQLMNIWAPRRTKRDGSPYHQFHPTGWRWGSAWRGHNCVEYRVWFKSRMEYQAKNGFITLGGNTVVMWTHLVKQLAWRDVPTEDCDQGVRLSVMNIPIRTFYVGKLVTREETPISLPAHSIQRRRWILGFFEVKGRAEWRQMPSLRRRLLAYEILSLPFWQAISGVMAPVSLATMVFFKAPVIIVLWTYVPAVISVMHGLVLQQAFTDFCKEFQLPVTRFYLIRFLLFLPIYQLALSFAAMRALKRYALRQYDWGKTQHEGSHLDAEPEPVAAG